jgi:hypothetical protein
MIMLVGFRWSFVAVPVAVTVQQHVARMSNAMNDDEFFILETLNYVFLIITYPIRSQEPCNW